MDLGKPNLGLFLKAGKKLLKLSERKKDYLIQGIVVSILIIPIISASLFGQLNVVKEKNQGLAGLKVKTLDKRMTPLPSRGGTPPATQITPPPQAATPAETPPVPAQEPEPQDPNLPPELMQNTQNLNSVILQRFDAFRTYIFQAYGVVLEIRSGWRSYEEQAQLYATLPPGQANPPGKSHHETGNAIDYTPYLPQYNQHLGQFGLFLPYPSKENWHIEAR